MKRLLDNPTQQTIQHTNDESDRIEATDLRGWRRNRGTVIIIVGDVTHRLVRLRRDDSIASGRRALPGDTNIPVSVGIYYPSESHLECHLIM